MGRGSVAQRHAVRPFGHSWKRWNFLRALKGVTGQGTEWRRKTFGGEGYTGRKTHDVSGVGGYTKTMNLMAQLSKEFKAT